MMLRPSMQCAVLGGQAGNKWLRGDGPELTRALMLDVGGPTAAMTCSKTT